MVENPVEWFYKRNPFPWGFVRSRSFAIWMRCQQQPEDIDGVAAVAICAASADYIQQHGPLTPDNEEHFCNYVNNAIYYAIIRELRRQPMRSNIKNFDDARWDEVVSHPNEHAADELAPLLELLTIQERQVVCTAYGIGCEQMEIKDIAERFNKTPTAIKKIRNEAIYKMRAHLRDKYQ